MLHANLQGEAPKAEESKEQTLLEKIKSFGTFNNDNSGAFEFSLGNIFKCFLCTRKDNYEETVQLKIIGDSLEKLTQKIEVLEKLQLIDVKDPESASKKLKIIHGEEAKEVTPSNQKFETIADKIVPITTLHVEEPGESYGWIDDESLQHGEVLFLSRKEQVFWDGLLEKYLHPIDDTKDKVTSSTCSDSTWAIIICNLLLSGSHREKFKRPKGQSCVCILHVKLVIRTRGVLTDAKERFVAH